MNRPLTTLELHDVVDLTAKAKHAAHEAEVEAYRLLNLNQDRYERMDAQQDAALDELAARQHALDAIDPSDPEVQARIAAEWADFDTPAPDTDGSQAAVAALARAIPVTGAGVDELPALVRADDGRWVPDYISDPILARASTQAILDSGCWPEEEEHLRTILADYDRSPAWAG